MAEVFEDDTVDSDRLNDQNTFLNSQFEVFTHDYREFKDRPRCSHDGGTDPCCDGEKESDNLRKKDVVNVTRKLNRALISLRAMNGTDVISDVLEKLEAINNELQELIKSQASEFTATNVALPEYDPVDMELLIGETPKQLSMLETMAAQETAQKDKLKTLVAQAEIMLTEYDHIKHGLRA